MLARDQLSERCEVNCRLGHEDQSYSLSITDRAAGSTEFTFATDEPATVYYTLDGGLPTLGSPKLRSAGLREGPESLTVNQSTAVRWFAVDIAGNVENGYAPDGRHHNYEH